MRRSGLARLGGIAVGAGTTGLREVYRARTKVSRTTFDLASKRLLRGHVDAHARLRHIADGLAQLRPRAQLARRLKTRLSYPLGERAGGRMLRGRFDDRQVLG